MLVQEIRSFGDPRNGIYMHSAVRVADGVKIFFAKKSQYNIEGQVDISYTEETTTKSNRPLYKGVKIPTDGSPAQPATGWNQSQQEASNARPAPIQSSQPFSSPAPQVPAGLSDIDLFLKVADMVSRVVTREDLDEDQKNNMISEILNKSVDLTIKIKGISPDTFKPK